MCQNFWFASGTVCSECNLCMDGKSNVNIICIEAARLFQINNHRSPANICKLKSKPNYLLWIFVVLWPSVLYSIEEVY